MEKDSRKEVSRMLAQLQQDLQSLRSHQSSRYSENHPYAVELEYYLTRLSTALNAIRMGHFSLELYARRERAELLAQIDAVLTQTNEIYELAEHAREVLLRPPQEDKEPGFTE
jgi:hypothetical protein